MRVLNDMRTRRSAVKEIQFLCVYIREAHAADVWPVDGPQLREPQTTDERIRTAGEFRRACGLEWPVAVDAVEDHFLRAFAPWPFRLYVLRGDVLELKTMPQEGTHKTDEVEEALRRYEVSIAAA